MERSRPRNIIVRAKEAFRAAVANGTGRCRASAGRQAGTCRNHGQISRHHVRAVQLRAGCGDRAHAACSET